jgi:RNA polymerase sigma factor (sigma-70 family)
MEPRLSPNLIGAYNEGVEKVRGIVCNKLRLNIADTIHERMGDWYDPRDLTSEVLIKLLEHEEKFDTMKKLENWVKRTTINTCIDETRKMKKRNANAHKVNALLTGIRERNIENVRNVRICQRLHDLAVQHLPPKSQEVYYLSYIDGMTVKLKIDESTVKNHRNYALNKLRVLLPDEPVIRGNMVFIWLSIPLWILYMLLKNLLS